MTYFRKLSRGIYEALDGRIRVEKVASGWMLMVDNRWIATYPTKHEAIEAYERDADRY